MKIKLVFVGVVTALLLLAGSAMAAINIDGDLSDWGLTDLPNGDWSQSDTWVPTDGIAFTVEDNHNPLHSGWPLNLKGVHIQGNGHTFIPYNEPLVEIVDSPTHRLVSPPYGNEPYDLEAMYFLQDDDYLYLAIITSEPPQAVSDRMPGDLALNLDQSSKTGHYGYEYGVRLGTSNTNGFHQGDIVYLPEWEANADITPEAPDTIKGILPGGNTVGTAQVAFTNVWLTKLDNGLPNYVIEIRIPKSDLGLSSGTHINFGSVFISENCMNDHIYVPEFPTVAVSVGSIVGVVAIVYTLRSRRKEE